MGDFLENGQADRQGGKADRWRQVVCRTRSWESTIVVWYTARQRQNDYFTILYGGGNHRPVTLMQRRRRTEWLIAAHSRWSARGKAESRTEWLTLGPVRWRRGRAGTPVRLPASYTLCSEIVTENLIDNLGEVYRVARCVHPMKL